jgi:hypothetical protein
MQTEIILSLNVMELKITKYYTQKIIRPVLGHMYDQ